MVGLELWGNLQPIWLGLAVGMFSTVTASCSPLDLALLCCRNVAYGSLCTPLWAIAVPSVSVLTTGETGGESATHCGYALVLCALYSQLETSFGSKSHCPPHSIRCCIRVSLLPHTVHDSVLDMWILWSLRFGLDRCEISCPTGIIFFYCT